MTAPIPPGPIVPHDRVSDVLARDESLVEVFVRHAPPLETAGEGSHTHPPGAPVVEVDVRDQLRAGREPFSQIMAAVAALRAGDVLHLRATFEPVPLVAVLAKRGFVHETRGHAPDDWSVWFWRPAGGVASRDAIATAPMPRAPAGADAPSRKDDTPSPDTVWLDVRGLEPPEPLLRTLAALEALPGSHTLVQVNVRVPQFLLPMLAERGFTCEITESAADRVLVRIWRPA